MNISATMKELAIDKDSFRVLGLLPLVYVAWADGTVQAGERSRIRKIAEAKGWLVGGGAEILDGWLDSPPDDDYAEKGLALLKELAAAERGVGAAFTAESLEDLLALCVDVARAAGGHWGFGEAICEDESAALGEVAEALGVTSADGWRRIAEDRDTQQDRPPGPKGHLIVGNLPELLDDSLALLAECAKTGDISLITAPGVKGYVLANPEYVQHVLVDNGRNYFRGRNFDPFRPILRESILTTNGDEWKRFRRLAQPAFHKKTVGAMAEMMGSCATEMCDRWQERAEAGEAIDVAAQMHALTLRIIGHALFGIDLSGESNREFSEAVRVGLEDAADRLKLFRIPDAIPTPKNLRFKRAAKYFDDTIAAMIAERRAASELGDDLLGMLLAARDDETGEGLSDEHIRNEVLTYLVAGHETTATTLTWVFYVLGKHLDVARTLDDELERVLDGRVPTLADTSALSYTEMVIKETLRLYPAAFFTSREAIAEDHIGGYAIERGSWAMISPWVIHRLPSIWEAPEGFDPLRFSPERERDRHPCAYLPFLVGPHKCIGQALSMLEMTIVLAAIRQRYRLDLEMGFEPDTEAVVTYRAKTLPMRVIARAGTK